MKILWNDSWKLVSTVDRFAILWTDNSKQLQHGHDRLGKTVNIINFRSYSKEYTYLSDETKSFRSKYVVKVLRAVWLWIPRYRFRGCGKTGSSECFWAMNGEFSRSKSRGITFETYKLQKMIKKVKKLFRSLKWTDL